MKILSKIIRKLNKFCQLNTSICRTKEVWKGSADYWNKRYISGGNSGAGSYNRLAEFKADVLNHFVQTHKIKSVVEWGCGDGNQLSYANYPQYVGLDVSQKAIEICRERFKTDKTKFFIWSGASDFHYNAKSELAISLDVVYHLIEDDVFEQYMRQLFNSSTHYVCIYSCNDNNEFLAPHVKHRQFSKWIEDNEPSWTKEKVIKNKYPYEETNPDNTSWSDFYFYEKKVV